MSMYIPPRFRNENPVELIGFIRNNSFGILVSHEGQLEATHIPMVINDAGDKLTGHVSRGNKQWKSFQKAQDVLVIFNGPHAYVSSSWYNHENVPTWNYMAVHVNGKIRIVEESELIESLRQLVNIHEKASSKPVSVEGMSPQFLSHEIKGIVGFEIKITSMEGAWKLSQNRDDENHQRIIKGLEDRTDPGSKEIADTMRKSRMK